MAGKSEFDLKLGRYFVRGDKPIVFVMDQQFAEPLLTRIRDAEIRKGSEFAEGLLRRMAGGGILNEIRFIRDLDVIKLASELKKQQDKEIRGARWRCNCSTIFYDMERLDARCPKCGAVKTQCQRTA